MVNLFDGADEGAAHICRELPQLTPVVEGVGPPDLQRDRYGSPYHALARSIVFQQLSGKAASTIWRRMCELFHLSADDVPTPQQLMQAPAELLRTAGVSAGKARSLHDLASHTISGTVPDDDGLAQLSDDEIIDQLTVVRGIGPWTVQMLLIFHLGRPDVLPVDDLGVRKGWARITESQELPSPSDLRAALEPARPWRSVASWYLWRAAELPG